LKSAITAGLVTLVISPWAPFWAVGSCFFSDGDGLGDGEVLGEVPGLALADDDGEGVGEGL